MKLSKNQTENTTIISISGEVDAVTGPELLKYFNEEISEQKNLIADLSQVEFISSAGLRALLLTVKETRKVGGDLRLAAVHEKVYKVLKISGFVSFLKIYPDVAEAIKSYS
jgi:anti-sigma B factor antagonist